ncbi:MAG: UDP-N-acetylmuramate:L-alanyl-gamma-D-glutamyl-meso-diaminopimelate ligase [Thiotrichales bacterium]
MHLHILGIAGTFMGGLAQIARAAGHRVTGADTQVYPPMSTQLEAAGISFVEGFDPAQLSPAPDMVVVGNVMSRGRAVIEALLDRNLPYTSGPQWLYEHVLRERWVLAVAGTHGKTTTASMLAWILEYAGLQPGFLIGGVPLDFGVSARLGGSRYFVIEADEYDTAFFDKRSKFLHYHPRTLIINNIEFDHADIFADLAAIQRQFHHLVRTVPGAGRIIHPASDSAVRETLAQGCWTPCEQTLVEPGAAGWRFQALAPDCSALRVLQHDTEAGVLHWNLLGEHNAANALAAVAAAEQVGVTPAQALAALAEFKGVRRRLELRGTVAGVAVYDDFAHHPTAIATTLRGLRQRLGTAARILAVCEPRSNTMRLGVHAHSLGAAFDGADRVYIHAPNDLGWDAGGIATTAPKVLTASVDELLARLDHDAAAGDHILIMSNGGFGGLHERLLATLAARTPR